MIRSIQNLVLVCSSALLLVACGGDPLVGRWDGVNDPKVDLDVGASSNGYSGNGHLYLCQGADCFLCPFEFDAHESGSEHYRVSGHFTNGCSTAGSFKDVQCDISGSAEDRLACEIGGTTFEYTKRD